MERRGLLSRGASFLFAKGTLRQAFSQRLRAMGWLVTYAHSYYGATGYLSEIFFSAWRAIGEARLKAKEAFTLTGQLENDSGSWFLQMAGRIKSSIYLFSVPNRMQSMITGKRWFRNG